MLHRHLVRTFRGMSCHRDRTVTKNCGKRNHLKRRKAPLHEIKLSSKGTSWEHVVEQHVVSAIIHSSRQRTASLYVPGASVLRIRSKNKCATQRRHAARSYSKYTLLLLPTSATEVKMWSRGVNCTWNSQKRTCFENGTLLVACLAFAAVGMDLWLWFQILEKSIFKIPYQNSI